jgi:hypothetical protein
MSARNLSKQSIASTDGTAPQLIVLCWTVLTLFCVLAGTPIGWASQKINSAGLYTHEQAFRGRDLYATKCAPMPRYRSERCDCAALVGSGVCDELEPIRSSLCGA